MGVNVATRTGCQADLRVAKLACHHNLEMAGYLHSKRDAAEYQHD